MAIPKWDGLPDHPAATVMRQMGRALFSGIPEVKSREQLLAEWGPKDHVYENGIDYEPAGPVSGAEGLSVVEFEERP
jgi:hypothetical protein